jgi:hypothetical protein
MPFPGDTYRRWIRHARFPRPRRPGRSWKDIVSNREALDLFRANSQLIRQIREVHDHIVAIEMRHDLTATSDYADVSHEFQSVTVVDDDVIAMRALNRRLRKELADYRAGTHLIYHRPAVPRAASVPRRIPA